MHKTILIVLLTISLQSALAAQVNFRVDSATVAAGSTFSLTLYASGLTDISALQFGLGWDAAVLELVSTEVNEAAGAASDVSEVMVGAHPDRVAVLYSGDGPGGPQLNLPDDYPLLQMQFRAIGNGGDSTLIAFNGEPAIEIIRDLGEELTSDLLRGLVHLQQPSTTTSHDHTSLHAFWNAPSTLTVTHSSTGHPARIDVFDASGRLLETASFAPGESTLSVQISASVNPFPLFVRYTGRFQRTLPLIVSDLR